MKYIYIKYNSDKRETFIKDKDEINYESKVFSNKKSSIQPQKNNKSLCKVISIKPFLDEKKDTINDEITKFFFDSIHKNYLRNR